MYEWQAVAVARVLAGRTALPALAARDAWEAARIAEHGDGVKFTMIFPHFAQYFDGLRALAGDAGPGRRLPPFDPALVALFMAGHERRKVMWEKNNAALAKQLQAKL